MLALGKIRLTSLVVNWMGGFAFEPVDILYTFSGLTLGVLMSSMCANNNNNNNNKRFRTNPRVRIKPSDWEVQRSCFSC